MEWLRFSYFAIGMLPTGILLCVLTIFLLTLKKKSLATWMLIVYFSVLSILLLSYVVRYSVLSTFIFNTGQISNLIVFGIVAYVLFAYLFQENYHPRETIIVTVLFSLAALYVYGSIFARYPVMEKTYDFRAHYFTYVYGLRISIVTGLGYVWVILVFFRKTVRASRHGGSENGGQRGSRMYLALVSMVRPRSRKAKSFQALALLTVGMFSISFMYLLMSAELISRETYGFYFNIVGLLTTVAIFIVYTNSTFDPSSFRWKLIGLSLAPGMLVLGILSSTILSFADNSFDAERVLEAEVVKSTLAERKPAKLPAGAVYVASRPAGEGPYSEVYVLEQSRHGGIRASDLVQSDRRERENQFSKSESGFMNSIIDAERERAHFSVTAELGRPELPEMERRFRYFDLHETDSFYLHYDFVHEDRVYEIGYRYTWYREAIHRTALKLFYVIVGTTVIILVLFPLFFYWNLFKIDLRIF